MNFAQLIFAFAKHCYVPQLVFTHFPLFNKQNQKIRNI